MNIFKKKKMEEGPKKPKKIEQPKQSDKFSDAYDVAKFTGVMHNEKLKRILGNDYVLAKLDEKEKKFVEEMFKLATKFEDFIEHEETAKRVFDTLMKEAHIIVILARNRSDNWLVKNILNIREETEDQEQLMELKHDKSLLGRIKKSFNRRQED
jgi:hypothetical protein